MQVPYHWLKTRAIEGNLRAEAQKSDEASKDLSAAEEGCCSVARGGLPAAAVLHEEGCCSAARGGLPFSQLQLLGKQKMVVQVSMNGEKCRFKALKIAVGLSGVESVGFQGIDKNEIEVKGEGIDSVELTRLLRKKVGYAVLVSVGPIEESSVQTIVWPSYVPDHPLYIPADPYYAQPSCSIL